MNRRLVVRLLGTVLLLEAFTLLPSLLVAVIYRDGSEWSFAAAITLLLAVGFLMRHFSKPTDHNMRAREGMVTVALAWILLIAFGAIPYALSGAIPNVVNALFESASGFTTTGATILEEFETIPEGIMFWRSFTIWIGGMGVLVLTLALLPQMSGRTSHLMRAESPGPSLSKLVPRMADSAKLLYLMYGGLTLLQAIALVAVGLSPYDALIHAFSTAGTGGFSNYADSVGHFQSAEVEMVIAVFMLLFGINFVVFYRLIFGPRRDAFHNEEFRWFLGFACFSVLLISFLLVSQYGNFGDAFRYGLFHVTSVMSTTGFATQDYTMWPQAAKAILLMLLFVGSCAGSTAGGLKIVRVVLLLKMVKRDIRHAFQPRKMQVVRFDGKGVEESLLGHIAVFFFCFMAMIMLGTFLISLEDRFDIETNVNAAITCITNVGPGFSMVGPIDNFSHYSLFSKLILSLLMLAGRLELFPLLVLFHPAAWRNQ